MKKKKIDDILQEIPLRLLQPHPLNREFAESGEAWDGFCGSIRAHGVLQPLVVRVLVTGYQILAGHRRYKAALSVGSAADVVPCVLRALDDASALEFLCIENLERVDPDPVEESILIREMLRTERFGGDVVLLAQRLNRSCEWISTRQRLLDLGDEVCEAIRRPVGDPQHLAMGTVEVLLQVADSDRERAVQLVLHPDWTTDVLRPREAAEAIRSAILEPARKRGEWERAVPKFVKSWKAALKKLVGKGLADDLMVVPGRWDDAEVNGKLRTRADVALTGDDVTAEGQGKTWAHLAALNGLPVWIVPCDSEAGCAPMVDDRLLRMAEGVKEENGLVCWLTVKKVGRREQGDASKKTGSGPTSSTGAEEQGGGGAIDPNSQIPADEYEDKKEAPPDERHVRREAGSMILVPKERIERAVVLMRDFDDRDLTDAEWLDLPAPIAEQHYSGLTRGEMNALMLEWVLAGCPILGGDKG